MFRHLIKKTAMLNRSVAAPTHNLLWLRAFAYTNGGMIRQRLFSQFGPIRAFHTPIEDDSVDEFDDDDMNVILDDDLNIAEANRRHQMLQDQAFSKSGEQRQDFEAS